MATATDYPPKELIKWMAADHVSRVMLVVASLLMGSMLGLADWSGSFKLLKLGDVIIVSSILVTPIMAFACAVWRFNMKVASPRDEACNIEAPFWYGLYISMVVTWFCCSFSLVQWVLYHMYVSEWVNGDGSLSVTVVWIILTCIVLANWRAARDDI